MSADIEMLGFEPSVVVDEVTNSFHDCARPPSHHRLFIIFRLSRDPALFTSRHAVSRFYYFKRTALSCATQTSATRPTRWRRRCSSTPSSRIKRTRSSRASTAGSSACSAPPTSSSTSLTLPRTSVFTVPPTRSSRRRPASAAAAEAAGLDSRPRCGAAAAGVGDEARAQAQADGRRECQRAGRRTGRACSSRGVAGGERAAAALDGADQLSGALANGWQLNKSGAAAGQENPAASAASEAAGPGRAAAAALHAAARGDQHGERARPRAALVVARGLRKWLFEGGTKREGGRRGRSRRGVARLKVREAAEGNRVLLQWSGECGSV